MFGAEGEEKCAEEGHRSMSIVALRTLYELKENNQLCDASILLEDGTLFAVHRVVLCASSMYFK